MAPVSQWNLINSRFFGGSLAERLACWTQAQKARVQIAVATLSGNSLRQTVYTHCASVHEAAKLVATLLRVAGVTAGLAESSGSLLSGLWLTSPAGWLPRTGISSGTLRSVIEYGLPFLRFVTLLHRYFANADRSRVTYCSSHISFVCLRSSPHTYCSWRYLSRSQTDDRAMLCVTVDIDRRKCGQRARPSTSFVDDTRSTCRGEIFRSPQFGTKFQREVRLFLR